MALNEKTGGDRHFYRRVMVNTIYSLASSMVASLAILLSNILTARSFDPANYGIITTVISVNTFFFLVADMGIATAMTKFIAEDTQDRERISRLLPSALKLTAGVALVAMGLLVSTSGWLARMVFHQEIGLLLVVSAAWIVSSLFFRVSNGVFNGFQRMEFSLVNTTLLNGLRLLALVVAVYLGLGVSAVVVGWSFTYTAALFLMVLLLLFFLRKKGFTLRWASGYERRIIKYGVYLALPFLGIYLIPHLLNMIMGWLSTMENVAYMSISLSLASLSFVVLTPVSNVLLPVASEAFAGDNWQRMSTVGRLAFKYLWLVSFGGLCFLAFFGEELITFLYGTEYVAAGDVLLIMAFSAFFESAKVITDPLLNGTKYARTVTWIEILKFSLVSGLGIGLIYLSGITGAAVTILVAYSASTGLKMYQVHKRLNIDLTSIAVQFTPLVLVLALFTYFDLPVWLFAIIAGAIIVCQRMISMREVRTTLSLFTSVRG
jgi:stage V sporulation protein B